ncbi:hypothetical protein [Trueperella bialowiezensis]|uniref:Phage protein D n=1 Tax=Trueperella bialowiezensis TaxID=312285 RepID=A0A3S4VT87_9ACTO|nr:hypothetical protein [Trueperella bialowiezensis]VEI13209.1 Uncharacterised protein [Trueperella bialowiezensis]
MALQDWWTFDLVGGYGAVAGRLDGVVTGSLTGNVHAQIRWAGRLTLDKDPSVDWGQFRVRPVRHTQTSQGVVRSEPYGVYLVRETTVDARPGVHRVELDLLDRTAVVAEDATATSFTVPAGTNIVTAVGQIIASTGEVGTALTPTDDVTSSDLVWEPGETKLRIINDLLEHAGYFALWADHHGQFRVEPYVAPQARPVAYQALPGDAAVHVADTRFDLPGPVHNRVICVSQSTGDNPAMIADVMNADPDSPHSFQAQGRWVTRVVENVEAASQAVLDQHAQRLLAGEGTSGRKISRRMLPSQLGLNAIITSRADGGGVRRETVETIEISLESAALMGVTSREVA